MKTRGEAKRIKITYKQNVKIPEKYRVYFWDNPDDEVYLEKFILRILYYGKFDDIRWLYENYPDETYDIAFKYPEIKRGVKFWIKRWREKK